MRIEVRGFTKTTQRKSARGSQGARGDGWCKRIIMLISGGKIEVENVCGAVDREREGEAEVKK